MVQYPTAYGLPFGAVAACGDGASAEFLVGPESHKTDRPAKPTVLSASYLAVVRTAIEVWGF
jgi:hypothetical protein